MKATQAGFVLGRALESFTASSTSPTPNLGSILIFLQPTQYVPKVADLLQSASGRTDQQAWLQSLADLNMTDASVFGDIAIAGSLDVQKDLHVGGVIYGATLNVDNITAKKVTTDQLCVDDVCVTREQFLKMVQMANGGSTPSTPTSPNNSSSTPPTNTSSTGSESPNGQAAPQSDSGLVAGTSTPPSDPALETPPAPTPPPTPDLGVTTPPSPTTPTDPTPPAPPTDAPTSP
jgi:hypothetical protein